MLAVLCSFREYYSYDGRFWHRNRSLADNPSSHGWRDPQGLLENSPAYLGLLTVEHSSELLFFFLTPSDFRPWTLPLALLIVRTLRGKVFRVSILLCPSRNQWSLHKFIRLCDSVILSRNYCMNILSSFGWIHWIQTAIRRSIGQ